MLLIPILVILGSARLLATDAYLAFEYGKKNFPPDAYGFTSQQRFELAFDAQSTSCACFGQPYIHWLDDHDHLISNGYCLHSTFSGSSR